MKVSHRVTAKGEHEAIIELRWYAQTGTFLVEAVGLGNSPEAAETSARLMLGQARAELSKATTEELA
jgi:hypothetical protein